MKSVQNQVVMKQKALKNQSEYNIEWNNVPPAQWKTYLKRVTRLNLLQSEEYALAMAKLNKQRIKRGVIYCDGKEAGIVQILEVGILKNAVHAVLLDRAPLWFDGFGSLKDFKGFLEIFSSQFPKRLGRKIRFIPEFEDSPKAVSAMKEYGYNSVSAEGYQTIWLNLKPELEILRKNLNKKWRNMLNQSERKDLEVIWSKGGANFAWLMTNYAQDKDNKGYDGASLKTVIALSGEFSRGQNLLIGTAMLDSKPIAAILLFIHGRSSTYQIGYTSDKGRECRAHHLLLWSALEQLKGRDIDEFDLGGVNDKSAEGVRVFKRGLGGKVVKTLGIYH